MTAIEQRLERIEQLATLGAKDVLGVADAAIYCGLSSSTIYKLTSAREIPHYKRFGKLYFNKLELKDWLLSDRVATNREMEIKAQTYITTRKKK